MIRIPSPSRRVMSLLIAAPFVTVACTSAAPSDATDEAVGAATAQAVTSTAPVSAEEEPAEATT